ncbi:MAG: glycoside hydrolase family 25 protein [Oscillospiraceae bacterium]|nr:glycoside hydrolase family 25 protein [Oscillospiraceae bacterium]
MKLPKILPASIIGVLVLSGAANYYCQDSGSDFQAAGQAGLPEDNESVISTSDDMGMGKSDVKYNFSNLIESNIQNLSNQKNEYTAQKKKQEEYENKKFLRNTYAVQAKIRNVEMVNQAKQEAEKAAAEQKAREEEEARKAQEEQAKAPAVTTPVVTPQQPVVQAPVEDIDISDVIANGIDVSVWQGDIDWQKVKAAGIQFVMIKAGEGVKEHEAFRKNIDGAKAAGLNCGIYWFSRAKSVSEAQQEADACISTISGYQLEYPVVYDCEYRSIKDNPLAEDKAGLTDAVLGFLRRIQSKGYFACYYTNADFSSRYLEFDRIADNYDIWFAGYSVTAPLMPCGIWQHSETGRVDGISTYVDLDISYKNYPNIMKKYHMNGF